jgi:hypothetical protein
MMPTAFRQPRRLSITVSASVYQSLLDRSDQQGRSLSNLAAYLLEQALAEHLPNNAVLDQRGRLSLPSHIDRNPNAIAYNAAKR